MVFKFACFVELSIDYQPAKFKCCRLSLASFIDRLRKHNDDVISCCWVSRNLEFCESEYRLSPLQVSNLLVVWIEFYGSYCKDTKKHHYNIIMTSFFTTEFPN